MTERKRQGGRERRYREARVRGISNGAGRERKGDNAGNKEGNGGMRDNPGRDDRGVEEKVMGVRGKMG